MFLTAGLVCDPSTRFPWITSPLTLASPWASYTAPNDKCCNSVNPDTRINFKGIAMSLSVPIVLSYKLTATLSFLNSCMPLMFKAHSLHSGFHVGPQQLPEVLHVRAQR